MATRVSNEHDQQSTKVEGVTTSCGKEGPPEHVDNISGDVVEKVHLDGTVDLVDKRAIGGDMEVMPPGYWKSFHFIGTVVAICCGAMVAILSWVLPASTLMLINESIGPSPNITWVATAWTLSNSIGYLLFGRLSDIFGRRWLTIMANSLSVVACIIAATAHDVNALIAANTLSGIAAAVQLSFPILLGELVANRHRGPIASIVFLACTPFNVFGPAISRLFILNTKQGWRWSFYLGLILSAITVVLLVLCYHPPRYAQLHVHGKAKWQQVKELDYGGLFLYLAGIILFLVGLSWGGQVYPWKSARVISTLVVGGLLIIAFGFYEQYVVKGHGLMPPRIFRNMGFVAITVTSTIGGMMYFTLTIMWPIITGAVYTTDVMKIGWQSSVVGGGTLLGQTIGGFGLTYIPKVKWQSIFSATATAAFTASLASIDVGTHAQTIVLGLMTTTFMGWIDNIGYAGVSLLFDAQDIGLACGLLGTIRSLGGAVSSALYVSILQNKVSSYLLQYVVPAALEAGLPQTSIPALFAGLATGDFSAVPGITAEIGAVVATEVRHAYVSSIKMVFYATIPFGFFLCLLSFWVPNFDSFLSHNVAKRLQSKRMDEKTEDVAP